MTVTHPNDVRPRNFGVLSGPTFEAASPMISIHLIAASIRNAIALEALPILATRQGGCLPAGLQHVAQANQITWRHTEPRLCAELRRGSTNSVRPVLQIDRAPSKKPRKLALHRRHPKVAYASARLELDQHIHVARIRKALRQHRPEECQLPDRVSPAKLVRIFVTDLNLTWSHPDTAASCRSLLCFRPNGK